MAAGLPGAGIGGLFYLASTVLLPFRSVWRRLRGRPDTLTLRELAWHLGMAGGIVAGIWVAGWVLGLIVPEGVVPRGAASGAAAGTSAGGSMIRMAAIAAGFLTLGAVLAGVEVARLLTERRGAPRATAAAGGREEG